MNAERILAHFERIADAPDAIPRVRRFILNLAVRGRLVEQDPSDKPASEALKLIATEKSRLMKTGEIRSEKPLEALDQKEQVFDLPAGWAWVRLGALVLESDSGWSPRTENHAREGEAWGVLKVSAVSWDYFDPTANKQILPGTSPRIRAQIRKGDFLISRANTAELIARSVLVMDDPINLMMSDKIVRLRLSNLCNHKFAWLVNNYAGFVRAYYAINATGVSPSMKNVSRDVILGLPVPLPPLAEQHRIVAKVDELMALCDRLEAARAEREATRDRLTAASLARLNAPDPDPTTFATHARFTLTNLPALTTRPEQIKHLRHTLLNLAVRGKLVPQDAKDEPAAELVARIGKEKARPVKSGDIRRERPLPPLSEEDRSFDLPTNWAWVRLGDLSKLVTSGSRDWAEHYCKEGAIFIRMGNLSKGHYRLRLDNVQRVNPPSDGEGTRTRLEAGDILVSITGDVGMLGLIPEGFGEAYINQHTAMVRPMPEMRGRYLAELFRSPFAQDQFNEPQRGIKNSFRLTDVTEFVVPLPPLAEQHRIVAKVDGLMALCDQLEASLTTSDTTRHRLLEALLAEALAPTETPMLKLAG